MQIIFRPCTPDDLLPLQALSRRTFQETFAHCNSPAELKSYLDGAYHTDKLRAQLQDEHSQFYFLLLDGSLAGYLKLNEGPAQTELHDSASLEVERIYLLREFQGLGMGGYLMERAIEAAVSRQKQYLWLGVWEHNEKAIAFYQRHGFYKIGAHSFFVGCDEQTDDLMRRDLR